jgi:MFS family permease
MRARFVAAFTGAFANLFALPANDLLRNPVYRRLWCSILISSFGQQVTLLAVPLTAAVLLHATPTQMGWLTAMEILPFVLFSLPVGVWLDRVRKLPVYIAGEIVIAVALASIPAMWALGWLGMAYLYATGFVMGCVFVSAGAAAQIVLTQVVPRERLVEAHAKSALAGSTAEIAGPGLAGLLIKLVGAPFALLADAFLLLCSVGILRGVRVTESVEPKVDSHFGRDLAQGLRFVWNNSLLPSLALVVGAWGLFNQTAMVVQILFATRELGLTEQQVGLSYTALGLGTVMASIFGNRISRRVGPGPCLVSGLGLIGFGWLQLAFAPQGRLGIASYLLALLCFGTGAVLIFINFLALRQAVTPAPLLGRMTSTMRWLILIPAGPGALLGGFLGEHFGLRYAMGVGGAGTLAVALWAWRHPVIRNMRQLPPAQG